MYLRHCCVGGKNGGKHNKPVTKKGQTSKQTHRKKSCHGSKGLFHGNMVPEKKHTHTPKELFEHFLLR